MHAQNILASPRAQDYKSPVYKELRELTTSLHEPRSKSHDLPVYRKPIGIQAHTNFENSDIFNNKEERVKEVLTFHGIILRSQLAEMFKNKIFFHESEGVSFGTVAMPHHNHCFLFM